ncbi:ATP-dependent zinc metalloprotease FtsH [Virgibacillus pantothenticus]|uniref:ATP-dependent zinc metalloprotease FtsH n=1 Tax=Virgibacillus pantothenticus TaxID=1473 RepID=UPI001C2485AC|nr:ATP-dependent zinc metalloprotease FtsH [Virgibacillus pantothenticus]MBU8568128.1 ATP-dependent zinc metalloprotease FtsH [Virgibacillus pantothenticus]MBU8602140.1 ATP-dependent zinc metalloprotease FtsH [Virgibacillus pantothenticus]MBU8636371.1 ATP-dependent zinc metalloprotease FtsH [Virgibacillus pantothenticus]MBU8644034.1 ATP-dependent zinc metalloprotease FtsH [Virgibacillus pantothenticus]MBU8648229.1 ATP-dependent zinc metalloprotease FtsH [Virgibacillus pantothenticus]
MSRIFRNAIFWILIVLVIISVISVFSGQNEEAKEYNVKQFMDALNNGEIKEMTMQPANGIIRYKGVLNDDEKPFVAQVPDNTDIVSSITEQANEQSVLHVEEEEQPSMWVTLLTTMIPFLIIGLFFLFILSQAQGGGGGGRVMNFGKSKAKMYSEDKKKVRFKDVAGADEEKQELVEVVEFLKDPRKFAALGARIPKGVLLVGPPGTGKTLLARAVAGEAGTPFFSISGSDFVEMFVGVGASRVRDLFENAKKNAPCIIFIDEIDAVGRQRGAGLGGGHDEREQTLNQLLVEMDGFGANEGIIIIAATNRADILDPALLRPGRFDRQIMVDRPDVKGRQEVLKVHARNKPLAEDVDLKTIAMRTPGFSGADLENLLNEAALVAARRDSSKIDMIDVDEAIDRVIAGPAKKSRVISKKERNIVAHHESGHTVIGMVLDDADMVHKVTIVPRGQAGGYAVMLPREDRYFMTKPELFDKITGLLGGRVAEEIMFGEVSTGAHNDFQRATAIARKMITEYGMSDRIGPLQFTSGGGQVFLGRDLSNEQQYSDAIAYEIDQEMQNFINHCYDRAKAILTEHKDKLELIAQTLLEVETLDAKQIQSLFEKGVLPEPEEGDVKVNIQSKDETPETYDEAKEKATTKDQEKPDDQITTDNKPYSTNGSTTEPTQLSSKEDITTDNKPSSEDEDK